VKVYTWNVEKNERLKQQRGVSFEEVAFHIQRGDEIDIFKHPNQDRYPGQKISVVLIDTYVYLVPFVESDEELFLKTIIPSRKATKQYLGDEDD
jgi:uncharacterized DUF497 family protein